MAEDEFDDLLILDIDEEIEAMEAEIEAKENSRQYDDEDPALQELDEEAFIREFQPWYTSQEVDPYTDPFWR